MAKHNTFTSNGITVEVDDMSDEILAALHNAVDRGLKAIGETAVNYASDLVPVNTGNLKDHITYEVDGEDCYVGVSTMNPPYGIYVEFGTGVYAETGGRQTPWVYKGSDGSFYQTVGQQPHPFIRPAAEQHGDEYRQILIDSLENA